MKSKDNPDRSLGQQLGEFVAPGGGVQLPAKLRRKVREHLLDTLGVSVAARRKAVATIANRAANRLGGAGRSSVWGWPSSKVCLLGAAFANGVAAHCLEYDDTHLGAVIHPSSVVIPAAVAVAEARDTDLGRLLQAIGLGWEVACRLGLLAGKDLDCRGFHVTGILGPFGAAAAVGNLLGLSPEKFSSALGLCCSQGSGTNQAMIDGSWNKAFHAGWASQSGAASAFLADEGFLGSTYGLEGTHGLLPSLLPQITDSLKSVTAGLGRQWVCSDIALKRYSCCHLIHACLDCVEELTGDGAVVVNEIDEVICLVPEEIVGLIGRPLNPTVPCPSVQAVRFSLPICMAMRLWGFAIGPQDFSEAVVNSEAIRLLASRVRCIGKRFPDYPAKYSGEVTLKLRSGPKRTAVVEHSRGTSQNPLSVGMLAEKFCRNVMGDLRVYEAQAFSQYMLTVEETEPVRRVLERLGGLVNHAASSTTQQ